LNLLQLAENQIDIWLIRPQDIHDGQLLDAYHQLLSDEERVKVARRHNSNARHDALVTRAFIRTVLSHYHPTAPQQWTFEQGRYGKPYISNEGVELAFNLSHASELIVCAISRNNPLGIDVEYTKRNSDTYKLASRYFSESETQALQALPYQQQAVDFYHYWTLKESYIKACGDGLAIPLRHFSFDITNNERATLSFSPERDDDPAQWQSFLFHPTDDHKMALSVRVDSTKKLTINMRYYVPLQQPQKVTLPLAPQASKA